MAVKPNPERARHFIAAAAAWAEAENAAGAVVAAVLRNDAAAVEAARQRAHDMLDEHIDHKIANIALMRADMARDFE